MHSTVQDNSATSQRTDREAGRRGSSGEGRVMLRVALRRILSGETGPDRGSGGIGPCNGGGTP
ncbi:protein of unknown function [Microbacterium sp. Nx66]|nr:protein of unknown function [Microbacterium sp. Nx66]